MAGRRDGAYRPNLTYRVLSRRDTLKQVIEVIQRHPNEAGIIYCISRKAVDELTHLLQKNGLKAVAYHAGLTSDQRREAQEYFAQEQCDLIVATVAFGMGIDRSNVRFVMHTGMPKSLEHYQQETGRAGRDGLESECVLLYSNADLMLWRSIMENATNESRAESGMTRSFLDAANEHLEEMSRYCRGAVCRHRALVEYFDQSYEKDNCLGCDICLGETAEVAEADIIAQKIVSCVARVKRPFGIGHIVSVLRGEQTESVRKWQHDSLSTYGIMSAYDKADLRDWIDQLIGGGFLARSRLALANGHSVPVVALNAESLKVLRKELAVRLLQPMRRIKISRALQPQMNGVSLADIDEKLFEALRLLRRQLAQERGWQPYMIFSDATLRELSSVRPSELSTMLLVKGVGTTKLQDFGEKFLHEIKEHCDARGLTTDDFASLRKTTAAAAMNVLAEEKMPRTNLRRQQAFDLFRQSALIEDVAKTCNVSHATALKFLCAYIKDEAPPSISCWVPDEVFEQVKIAAAALGKERLKPIYLALGEQVSYDHIRLALTYFEREVK